MKIYTKTGDSGTTALFGGTRVKKYNLRIESYNMTKEHTANKLRFLIVFNVIKKPFIFHSFHLTRFKNKTEDVVPITLS